MSTKGISTTSEVLIQKSYIAYKELTPFPYDYPEWRMWYLHHLGEKSAARDKKIKVLRDNMPGFTFGINLVPYVTDDELLAACEAKNLLARIHNRASDRLKRGDR